MLTSLGLVVARGGGDLFEQSLGNWQAIFARLKEQTLHSLYYLARCRLFEDLCPYVTVDVVRRDAGKMFFHRF